MAYGEEIPYKIIIPDDSPQKRKERWEIGKGLQAVDSLQTSKYLEDVIQAAVRGEYGTADAQAKLREYYAQLPPGAPEHASKEGDEVTARIVETLETFSFSFSPIALKGIHRRLFEGIEEKYRPGAWRTYNFTKEEPVLNGRSVRYADHSMIMDQLDYDFSEEKKYSAGYHVPFREVDVRRFAAFVSRIWETHGFCEGNTRVIAVFAILYLQDMGIPADNEYFKNHSAYFRDALVRSNFRDIKEHIEADPRFLEKFFENMLIGASHDLESIDLRCDKLLGNQ